MNTTINQYTRTPNNLLALLSRYRVVVPGVQRHYVQGANTHKALSVREQFVREIFSTITNPEKLHLHFIFGPIDTDGEDSLVPVDGQQRLTTLWLIARYATERLSNTDNAEILKLLSRFSYADRINATRFCNALTSPNTHWNIEEKPHIGILEQPWFLDYWKEDETVASMLRMLSTIHDEWQNHNITGEQVLEALGERILFELETNSFGDDIYMKMNARGLQLTQWENFKSKFTEYLGDYKSTWEEEIEKLSNEFFEKTPLQHELPDSSFFALFARIAAYIKTDKCNNNIKELAGFVHETWEHVELPFVPFSDFMDIFGDDRSLGEKIAKTCSIIITTALQYHKEIVPYFGKRTLFETLFHPKNQNDLDYGISCYEYFETFSNKSPTEVEFLQASRLIWNILENVEKQQNNPFNRIKIIKKFISLNTPSLYSLEAVNVISENDNEQAIEEAEKSRKMHDSDQRRPIDWNENILEKWIDWRSAIEKAEETAFFNGSIRFLYQDANGDTKWDHFATKLIHCSDLFNEEGLNDNKKVIANQVLISHCKNWEIIKKTPVFGSKKDNWKRILIKKSLSESVHNFLLDPDNISKNLDKIIAIIVNKEIWTILIKDNENYELEYKVDLPCLWLNRYLSRTLKLERTSREDILDALMENQDIHFELEKQDRYLTINGLNYYYAIPIFFKYSYNEYEYRFAWQTWGWVDMYEGDEKLNGKKDQDERYDELCATYNDPKHNLYFSDADGLIDQLKRCIKEYKDIRKQEREN